VEKNITTNEVNASPATKPSKKKTKKPSRIAKWFREMKSELKKVAWPTPKQVLKNALIVVACVLVVGIFIWVFDLVAGAVVNGVIGWLYGLFH